MIANKDGVSIPVCVAGNIMADVQSLIVHIGEQLIENEMLSVYKVPSEYLNRYILHISKVEGRSITLSAGTDDGYTGAMMDDAVKLLTDIFNRSGDGSLTDAMYKLFPDPCYMSWIASDLNALSLDMKGFSIQYSSMGSSGLFKGASEEAVTACPEQGRKHSSAIGLISSGTGGGKLIFDSAEVALHYSSAEAEESARKITGSMLGRVFGELVFSRRGVLTDIRGVYRVEPVSSVRFSRIISPDRDVAFGRPVVAHISFGEGEWTIRNKEINLEIKCPRWDDAVRMFHNRFMMCFEAYCAKTAPDMGAFSRYFESLSPVSRD